MDDLRKQLKEAEDEIERQRQELKIKDHTISTTEGGIMVPHCSVTKLFQYLFQLFHSMPS